MLLKTLWRYGYFWSLTLFTILVQAELLTGLSSMAYRLPPLPSSKEILKLYRVHAQKSLSQNFLLEPKLTSKIVSKAGNIRGSYVCEVGPGPGSITRAILQQNPNHVIVVEKDHRFLPALKLLQEASKIPLSIYLFDILNVEMSKLFPESCRRDWDDECPPVHIIGNLPFNVSLPLILMWLRRISERSSAWSYGRTKMTLTFQEEVAERMIAPAGHPERCRLSIMCQNYCKVTKSFTINGSAFIPKPKVDVGVVTLEPLVTPYIDVKYNRLEKLTRSIFNTKNKFCRFSIKRLFPYSKRSELARKMLTLADVDPAITGVDLTIEEFQRLTYAYSALLDDHPALEAYDFRQEKDKEEDFGEDFIT